MKQLRPFLFPAACFATAWAVAFLVSKERKPPPPAEPPANTRSSVSRAKPGNDAPHAVSVETLAEDFRTQPMSTWETRWEEFASHATADELESIPRRFKTPRETSMRRDASNVLMVMAQEELAVRSKKPTALEPYAYAALAEADPEAAWRSLERYHSQDLATAVLRTAARKDPEATLKRYQSMPAPTHRKGRYEADAGEGGMTTRSPIGAIFASWARQDPTAAAAAVRKLPPSIRTGVAADLAATWAQRDGPAAIHFILGFIPSGEGNEPFETRLDEILRASFRSHPAETAKLMAETPNLRQAMENGECLHNVLKSWYTADPDGVTAWATGEETRTKLDPTDATARRDSRCWKVYDKISDDPQACARFLRALAATGSNAIKPMLTSLYYRDSATALSLEDELGIPLERKDEHTEAIAISTEPAAACDRWLETLHRLGDPEKTLEELGWTQKMANDLATRACRVFPKKAAELAKLVPASSFDATSYYRKDLARFWPELAPAPVTPVASGNQPPPFPESQFKLDPATAAEALLARPLTAKDVTQAVGLWAPHDFTATRAWLSRLPEGEARAKGELSLAKIQAPYDPLAALDFLTRSNSQDSVRELWNTCLHRLALTGGDWRPWLDRMPEKFAFEKSRLPGELAAEARLLDLLRKK